MVAARVAYSTGRVLARKASAAFAVFFGLFALFFVSTPKLWGPGSLNGDESVGLFAQNKAHAEIPLGGDGGGDSGAGGGGDSGCGDSGDSGGCCA